MKSARASALLLCISLSLPTLADEYYDQSIVSFSQYNMASGMPDTDAVIDDWFEAAFEDEIRYDTQEFTFRSPRYKDFSIDVSGLLSAENEREKYSAGLKWKGIKFSLESGSAKGKFISNFSQNETFVDAGTSLPTTCNGTTEYDCLERVMIHGGEEVEMTFEGTKIQYAFRMKDGVQSVFGYSKYNIETPILLSRKLDPNVTPIGNSNGNQVVSYDDKELWQSVIDANGKTEISSLYFGMDGTERQLINAYNRNQPISSGPVGSFFCMLSSIEVESSGEQETYLNETYDVEINKAQDYISDLLLTFEFNLGYMVTFMYDRTSKSQGFLQAGVRGVWFLTSSLGDDPAYESSYVIDEFSGDSYNGYYLTAGATF
jgi:hypothetical protein